MARPRAPLDQLRQGEIVTQRLKSEPPGLMRERLLAVTHGLAGELSLDAIACVMGRSRATIQTWFDSYRKGGVAQLCSLSETKRGVKGLMTAPMRKALHQKVAKGSFRRVQDAHEWLVRKFGVDVKVDTVGRWLGKLGARVESGSTSPPAKQ